MSTNIRGYIARTSLEDLYHVLVDTLKPKVFEKGRQSLAKTHGAMIAEYFDKAAMGRIETVETRKTANEIASHVHDEVSRLQKEVATTGYRNHLVDHEFKVMLFPQRSQTLILPFSEQQELNNLLNELLIIEDYSYWNSTDRPDGISAKTWKTRENDWNAALPGSGVPRDRGLELMLFDGDARIHYDYDLIWKFIPSIQTRIKNHAKDLYIGRQYDTTKGMSQVFHHIEAYQADDQLRRDCEAEVAPYIRDITPETEILTDLPKLV